ncbi:hypothetical protein [Actinomadura flavalba]|uniref:hypothetical protein n=1 Tax=Actinomadura flavalba TaxID=1120938 RepID=UPI00035F265F|nr:hypothetical protein [Actinomadura flavalba]
MSGHDNEAGNGPRLLSWRSLIPLTVAVGASLTIAGGLDTVERVQDHLRAKQTEATTSAQKKPAKKTEPRYVVGVRRAGGALVVRDAKSGKDVGVPVAAPADRRFQRVAAAGGARSYVVASAGGGTVTFDRLKLDDKGRPTALTAIPDATVKGRSTAWSDLAVTPDGDRIAYVAYQGTTGRIAVLNAETGERKVWTTRASARIGSLSWAGDTLSFVWSPSAKRHQLRTLDTTAAAGDLKTSRAVLRLPAGSRAAVLSRDGGTVLAGVADKAQTSLRAYSVATGQPTDVLWTRPVDGGVARLDADGSGGHLLASGADGTLYGKGALGAKADDLTDVAW